MSEELNPFAAPQADLTASPQEQWAQGHTESLRKVKTGLMLVYTGICGVLLCAIGSVLVSMTLGGVLNPVFRIGVLVFGVVSFIGQIACTAAPRESGARSFAIAAVVLTCVSVLAVVSLFATGLAVGFGVRLGNEIGIESYLRFVQVIAGLQIVANLASQVCYIYFLKRLALFVERSDIAGRAVKSLIVGVISLVAIILAAVTSEVLGIESLGLLAVIGLIGLLIAFVMYANTITYLRKAIPV